MDGQRINAYLEVIAKLLQCNAGEEMEVLRAHQELLDGGFVQVGMAVAEQMRNEGREEQGLWLAQFLQELVNAQESERPPREDYREFIGDLIYAEATKNRQQVQELLRANVHLLDENFAAILQILAEAYIAQHPEVETDMVALVENLCARISQFPLGVFRINLEIAIAGYLWVLQHREKNPELWAQTQNNLGAAYWDLGKVANTAENLEKAIAAYQEALRFYTPQEYPQYYAGTQNNLGTAYSDLGKLANTAENLDKAIAAYREALRFYTPQEYPQDYAMTQNNLGNAYGDLGKLANTAENLEKAIAAYREALRFFSPQEYPQDYAMTQNNLGNAYGDLGKLANTAENLEKAIAAYREALRFRTPQEYPQYYATTQNNLGNAYSDLGKLANTAENLDKAIAAYQEALRFRTPQEYPQDYAMTQNNLGTAYWDLGKLANTAENLEKAIAAYREALRFHTPQEYPQQSKYRTKVVWAERESQKKRAGQ
ncbi:tetratricopeptide repeat protein [Roseofilum casamattae]|uniref:Tetratricopeptide repeat protein n=1 Tax=Roseofilum casamattae BLCC-M143 TaxID=3022442 RepID=A0ABT7C3H3_9CYAN|nr:tetratricopeptide repeat protein [Roseofilum casamattae]MDJ1185256.1 tetratricopeptide repeat protein [Roseofilum casamattae BLCC-M143]